jgi:hypothetical protein
MQNARCKSSFHWECSCLILCFKSY